MTVPQRKKIQNKIKDKYTLPVIKLNFINNNINSTKIFLLMYVIQSLIYIIMI